METLDPNDIETLDPNDMEVIGQDDFEVVPPPSLPEKVASGISKVAQESVAPIVQSGEETLPGITETALDTSRAIGSGLLIGGVDEIGGALSAGVESLYNKFNPTDVSLREQGFKIDQPSLPELYRSNQQDIQKELEKSEERSPIAYTGGQIAGGLTSGSVLAGLSGIGKADAGAKTLLQVLKDEGKAKAALELLKRGGTTYAKAAPAIALEAGLSSREGGVLEDQERGKLAEDVTGGLLFGLPAVLGLQATTDLAIPAASKLKNTISSKVKEVVEDSPLLRQMKISQEYGKQGINPRSTKTQLATELGQTNLAELDNSRVQELMKEIYSTDSKIGKAVGDSLQSATSAGKYVDFSGDAQKSISQLMAIAQKYPEIGDNQRAVDIFTKIAQNQGRINPIEARELIDVVDSYIGKFKTATNKTPLDEQILSNLIKTRKDFSTTLKTAVPEYAQAAERMASFRKLVPETIIARNRPVEVTDNYFGDLRNQDQKLFDSLKSLVQGTTKTGTGASETRTAFVNMIKGMKEFEQGEAARLASGEIKDSALKRPTSAIEEQIKKYSDDAVARGSMDAISPQAGIKNVGKEALLGYGAETGRSLALAAANKAGFISRALDKGTKSNPVAKLGRGIYNAPDEVVGMLATRLESTPGLEKYGKVLNEAIQSGNNNKKNQALFTIMQNPSARAVVGTDDDNQEE